MTGEVRPDEHETGFPDARRLKSPPLVPKLGRPKRQILASRLEDGNLPSKCLARGISAETMTDVLSADAIEALLREEIVARVAYVDQRGRPCIVPITYAYDGKALYGYSMLGSKIEGMSSRSDVCIEIDRIRNSADWWSIVVRGTFEQLSGNAAVEAVERISDRLRTVARVDGAPNAAAQTYVAREGGPGIAYRIRVTERHGRSSAASR